MNSNFGLKLKEILLNWGLPEQYAILIKSAVIVILLILLSYLVYLITNKILFRIIQNLIKRTKHVWDDMLFQRKVFKRLSHFAPAIVIYYFAKIGLVDFPQAASLVQSATYIYMIFTGMLVLDAFLNAMHDAYLTLPISNERPIKGYIQSVKIVIYAFGIIIIAWGLVVLGFASWRISRNIISKFRSNCRYFNFSI